MPLPQTPRDTLALRKKVFDIVKRLSFSRGSFVLVSGRTSNYYLDMKPTMLNPEGASLLAELVLNKLEGVKMHYIGGLAMGGGAPLAQGGMVGYYDARPP